MEAPSRDAIVASRMPFRLVPEILDPVDVVGVVGEQTRNSRLRPPWVTLSDCKLFDNIQKTVFAAARAERKKKRGASTERKYHAKSSQFPHVRA